MQTHETDAGTVDLADGIVLTTGAKVTALGDVEGRRVGDVADEVQEAGIGLEDEDPAAGRGPHPAELRAEAYGVAGSDGDGGQVAHRTVVPGEPVCRSGEERAESDGQRGNGRTGGKP